MIEWLHLRITLAKNHMNFRILLFAITLITQLGFAQSMNYEWVRTVGGVGTEIAMGIVSDVNGNVYTAGYFEGTVDFDPGSGTEMLTADNGNDIFVKKMDANGNLVWVTQLGGTSWEEAYGIALDPSGNILITGYFTDTLDLDPGTGVNNLISNGSDDILVVKMDANGSVLWGANMGGSSWEAGHAIATDATGNVYTTGFFQETADFDPGTGTYDLISAGGKDIFVQKLDANGNFEWAKRMGAPGSFIENDEGTGIVVDDNGYVITVGHFEGSADFNPDDIGTWTLTSNGQQDIFIQKLDANGNYFWSNSIGGDWDEYVKGVTVDSQNNIVLTGSFRDTVDFDVSAGVTELIADGFSDGYILKLNMLGNLIWVNHLTSTGMAEGIGIDVDGHNNIYTTGRFRDTLDIDPGAATNNLITGGIEGIFIQKLDENGGFVWGEQLVESDLANGMDITVQDNGFVYSCGFFNETVIFDFETGGDAITSQGFYDMYVHKIAQDVTSIQELPSTPKEVVKIVDLLGRETNYTPNTVLIYIYSDGTSERIMKLEH